MAEYNEKQKEFIKNNCDMLISIFKIDLEEVKDKILVADNPEPMIKFANYLKEWIEDLLALKPKQEEKKEKMTGI